MTKRESRITRPALVRELPEQSAAPHGSVWDQMRELVIRSDTAPADLASNKALLRGYGRSRRH